MKTLAFIVLMAITVATLAQEKKCPDEVEEQTNEQMNIDEVIQNNTVTLRISSSSEVMQACSTYGELYRHMQANKEHEIKPSFDSFLVSKCKPTNVVVLHTIWHDGEFCNVIFPFWQNIKIARCDFKPCCQGSQSGRCWPHNYVTYNILVHCPKSKQCRFIRRTYPTTCACRRWKC